MKHTFFPVLVLCVLSQSFVFGSTRSLSRGCSDKIIDYAIHRSEELSNAEKESEKYDCSFRTDGPVRVKYASNIYTLLIPCHSQFGAENESVISQNKTWNGLLFVIELSGSINKCNFKVKGNPLKTNLVDDIAAANTQRHEDKSPVVSPEPLDSWERQSLFED